MVLHGDMASSPAKFGAYWVKVRARLMHDSTAQSESALLLFKLAALRACSSALAC